MSTHSSIACMYCICLLKKRCHALELNTYERSNRGTGRFNCLFRCSCGDSGLHAAKAQETDIILQGPLVRFLSHVELPSGSACVATSPVSLDLAGDWFCWLPINNAFLGPTATVNDTIHVFEKNNNNNLVRTQSSLRRLLILIVYIYRVMHHQSSTFTMLPAFVVLIFQEAVPAGVELCGGGGMAVSIAKSIDRLIEGDEEAAVFKADLGDLLLRPL